MAKTKTTPAKAVSKKPAAKKVVPKKVTPVIAPKQRSPLTGLANSARFAKLYMAGAIFSLLSSTAFWATMSARLQQGNADQLVNSYLFESTKTFQNALLPGQHSFLLKWPVFLLVKTLGASGPAFIGVTIGLSLLTVGVLAAILYKIERRPLVFGTLCLALASVLLLVPAQPYAGGLLPFNMAMIATRNIEYLVYIGALATLFRWPRVKSLGFWLATLSLSILIASDKLFLTLSLGGAGLALIAYVFTRRWRVAEVVIKWFVAAVFSVIGSIVVLWEVGQSGVTHIASQSTVGGYGLIHHLSEFVLGSFYAFMGLLSNFGANPAYGAPTVRAVPHTVLANLASPQGLSYVVNALVLLAGLYMAARLLIASLSPRPKLPFHLNGASKLSLVLIWTTVAAVGAFIASNHYYLVDARYLTIALFTLFIVAATYSRQQSWRSERILVVGVILAFGLAVGFFTAVDTYQAEAKALKTTNDRNSLVAQALSHHPVDTLVGDYWRVMPTKADAKDEGNKLNVLPLADCIKPRGELSSKEWQLNLGKHSFAYLLSFDKSLSDYPQCSLGQAVEAYGRPNASAVIAGTIESPKEVLLFYDKGTRLSSPTINAPAKPPATVVPIDISTLPNTGCAGPSVMNIVAHQDDDLLFMSPDLLHDIKDGHCVRTVYVTAGDAGGDQFYWLSREQGSEAAYSKMIGSDVVWVQRVVKISDNEFINVANPQGNSRISLIFIRLADGNLKGQGFANDHNESLVRLEVGKISQIHSVTKQSTFTSDQVVSALSTLMHTYQPAEIRTQSNVADGKYPDHADHLAVGRYVQKAYGKYEQEQYDNKVKIPLTFYIGYPIHGQPQNVFGDELKQKDEAFFAYSKFDAGVCQTAEECSHKSTIGIYLQRQYQSTH